VGESGKPATDAWLDTVAAEASAAGCESPSQTISPDRRRSRASAAEALLADLDDRAPALELGETLGRGGMAVIHLGRQTRLDRLVAVKALRDDRSNRLFAAELVREARLTGSLEHPNIVPIHDIVNDDDGRPQVVMKRIDGTTWAELLAAADRAPAGDITRLRGDLEILIQVANAVRFAHAQGVVHRDLKPANVMIGSFGEVYVVDWGLAIEAGEADVMAGTPAYMAPEMLGGPGAIVDPRTDVYLLGGVLLEIMSGAPPHPGPSLVAALEHVRDGEVAVAADAPDELAAVCRRALARNPDDRHQTVDELVAELRSFLEHLGSATLAAEAGKSLARLRELLATPSPDRQQVYNWFGECRFGFRAALAAWPDNRAARDGLFEALEMLVEHELGRGDEGAASALLAEHPDPPAELAARIARAAGSRVDRERRLEKLETDFDPSPGQWPRLVATVIMSLLWVGFPAAMALADVESMLSRESFLEIGVLVTAGWTAVLFAVIMALRRSLQQTRFNRVIVWGAFLGAVATVFMMIGARVLGNDAVAGLIPVLLIWSVVAAVIAVAVERLIAIPAAGYLIAYLVSLAAPELRHWMMAAANGLVAVTAILAWGRRSERRP
jgi:serine/threonine-protein kinase